MATITPQAPPEARPDTPPPRRWWWLAIVGAVIVALIAGAIAWWPDDEATPTPTTTPTTAPTTTPPTTAPVTQDAVSTLYFLAEHIRDSNLAGPHLIAIGRNTAVPIEATTTDLVRTSVLALIDGVNADDQSTGISLSSSIEDGTELLGVSVSGGVATLDFDEDFAQGAGSFDLRARLAQLVYTATAVPGVDAVVFSIEGEEVEVFGSEGIVLDGPQTRDDWTDLLPLIMVEAPLPGVEIQSPIALQGIANAFEATVNYRLVATGGDVLAEGFTTATCGTGCFGDFGDQIFFAVDAATPATLEVFEFSANDGSAINIYAVPITLQPGGEAPPVEPPPARSYDIVVADLPAEPIAGTVLVDVPWGDVGVDESGFGPCCFDVYDIDSVVVLDAANLRLIRYGAGAAPEVLAEFPAGDFVPDALATISDRVIVLGMTNRTNRPHDAIAISLQTGEILERVETSVPMNVDLRATPAGVYWATASSHPEWTAIADSSGALLDPTDQVTTEFLPGESTLDVYYDAGIEVNVQPAGDSPRTTYDVIEEEAAFADVLFYQRYSDGALVVFGSEFGADGRAKVRLLELGTDMDNQLVANLFSFDVERWAETGAFNTMRYASGGLYVLNTTPDGMEIVRYVIG